jgi:hypothetical protein
MSVNEIRAFVAVEIATKTLDNCAVINSPFTLKLIP